MVNLDLRLNPGHLNGDRCIDAPQCRQYRCMAWLSCSYLGHTLRMLRTPFLPFERMHQVQKEAAVKGRCLSRTLYHRIMDGARFRIPYP
jgi:hypothetical protein